MKVWMDVLLEDLSNLPLLLIESLPISIPKLWWGFFFMTEQIFEIPKIEGATSALVTMALQWLYERGTIAEVM